MKASRNSSPTSAPAQPANPADPPTAPDASPDAASDGLFHAAKNVEETADCGCGERQPGPPGRQRQAEDPQRGGAPACERRRRADAAARRRTRRRRGRGRAPARTPTAIADAPATPPRSMATRPTKTPRVSPLGASVHGADCTVTRLARQPRSRSQPGTATASVCRPAGSGACATRAPSTNTSTASPGRASIACSCSVTRAASGERGSSMRPRPVVQRPGRPRCVEAGPKPVRKGASPGRPRTMADGSGAATSSAAKTRAAATAAPSARLRPVCARGLRRGEPARLRLRRGAVGHRRTTSSPCSSWGRPSEPVREQ